MSIFVGKSSSLLLKGSPIDSEWKIGPRDEFLQVYVTQIHVRQSVGRDRTRPLKGDSTLLRQTGKIFLNPFFIHLKSSESSRVLILSKHNNFWCFEYVLSKNYSFLHVSHENFQPFKVREAIKKQKNVKIIIIYIIYLVYILLFVIKR